MHHERHAAVIAIVAANTAIVGALISLGNRASRAELIGRKRLSRGLRGRPPGA